MAYNKYGNSFQRNTPIVFNLLIINVLVFAAQNMLKQYDITEWGSLHYYKSSLFKPHQLITYMFLHGDTGHILFNMFGLWMFGTILERVWGPKRFLIFYLVCGVGAGIFQQFLIPYEANQIAGAIPQSLTDPALHQALIDQIKEEYAALGASGAIMGIMAAFAYLFPNTQLYIMFIPIPVKAKYVIPVFVLLDLFGGIYRIQGDNIGHFAHLGGALIGFLLVYYWNRSNKKTFY